MYDQRLMDRCIQYALKNPIQSRGRNTISRMAALIAYHPSQSGQIIGYNKYKSHPMMYRFSKDHTKISLHAEIDAIVKFVAYYGNDNVVEELGPCSVYISRVLKDGTPALARPCNTCFGALTYFGIHPRNIHWTK